MNIPPITLSGHVRSQGTKTSLPNLKVEAWDADIKKDDLAGSAITDTNGHFSIGIHPKELGWLALDRRPDIYFKVYAGEKLLLNTAKQVLQNLDIDKTDLDLQVNLDQVFGGDYFLVYGAVQSAEGTVNLVKGFAYVAGREYLLGESGVDDDGQYRIACVEAIKQGGNASIPRLDVIVRAFEGNEIVGEALVKNNTKAEIKMDIEVKKEETAPDGQEYKVFGVVRNALGELANGLTIMVYDRDLRTEHLLGRTVTHAGSYLVAYQLSDLRKPGKTAADILIKVLEPNGEEVSRTGIHFKAPAELEVNISLSGSEYKGASEWETIMHQLTPLLDGVAPMDLREDEQFQDVSFLAGESELSQMTIGLWAISFHLAAGGDWGGAPLDAPVLFGLLRLGSMELLQDNLLQYVHQTDRMVMLKEQILKYLGSMTAEQQEQLFSKAIGEQVIPEQFEHQRTQILAQLQQIRLEQLGGNALGGGKGSLGELLGISSIAPQEQKVFLEALAANQTPLPVFWQQLETQETFAKEVVADLRLTFELGSLTRNHIPLVSAIKEKIHNHELDSPRDLAKYDEAQWITLFSGPGLNGDPVGVPANVDGGTQEEQFAQYAYMMGKSFESQFPTTSFGAKLLRSASMTGNANLRTSTLRSLNVQYESAKTDVAAFLDTNPDFALEAHRIDHYLAENPRALQGVGDEKATVAQLKSIQRVFKLAPTFQVVDALLSRNIHSSQQIYFMGKEQFVSQMDEDGVNRLQSKQVYAKASNAYATAINLFGTFNNRMNGLIPTSLPWLNVSEQQQSTISQIPNLQTLFGSLDYCECTHCRSVYSPSAYFVDVMRFLGDRQSNGSDPQLNANKSLQQVVLRRRSDLGELELSCENTNTPLPYIDLVNEVLEDVVSPPVATVLSNAIEVDLVAGKIRNTVKQAFWNAHLAIGSDADVYARDARGYWVVRDAYHAYQLFKEGGLFKVLPTKQTHLSAAELRANPEYTNAGAYDKLAQEVFPLPLPFDLWQVQTRAYLAQMGLDQPTLFELFQQKLIDNTTLAPTNSQIDCAYLGLSETERRIVTGTLPGKHPWDYWGLALNGNNIPHPDTPANELTNITGDWITVLSHVPVMLHRTGLAYRELLQLLDMQYVNPDRIAYLNDNTNQNAAICDVSTFLIMGLTSDMLDRIHRFVRLWRRLGCKMWELDLLLPEVVIQPQVVDHGGELDLQAVERKAPLPGLAPEGEESLDNLDGPIFLDIEPIPIPTAKAITNPALHDIACMRRLKEQFNWDWSMVMALYHNIDNTLYYDRSKSESPAIQTLYQRLFRNKLVDVAATFPADAALIQNGGAISNRSSVILAAMRIKAQELDLILADIGLSTTSVLNWTILSRIYRTILLAQAVGLSIDQFLRLKRLSGLNPFLNPSTTIAFVQIVAKVSESGLSILEMDYLLAHRFVPNGGIALEDPKIVTLLGEIRSGLQKVVDDLSKKPEETAEEYVKSHLGQLPSLVSDVDKAKALTILYGTSDESAQDNQARILAYFDGYLDLGNIGSDLEPLPGGLLLPSERFALIQPLLESYLLRTGKEAYIVQKIAEIVDVEQALSAAMLSKLHLNSSTTLFLKHLTDPKIVQRLLDGNYEFDITEGNFGDQFDCLRILHKAGIISKRLGMQLQDLDWWITRPHPHAMEWVRPHEIPVNDTTSLPLATLLNMSGFSHWKRNWGSSTLSTYDFLDIVLANNATPAQAITALAKLTAWDENDLQQLIDAFRWDVITEFTKLSSLLRLTAAMKALRQMGVSAVTAIGWANAFPTAAIAESMKQSLKAKYELAQWLQVIQPLQDSFREQKRNALVAWLIAHPSQQSHQNWTDSNGLYSYFLIDVEIGACMLTSRIKQAGAALQLFVQRCLMNLEEDVVASVEIDSKWKQWPSMRYYRVWEANRKVFLYPENWIEPELRDEKSPFFKELENELLQTDITNESAEQAYLNYLESLDKVSNLEIRAIYDEVISSSESVLHVFGRSRSSLAPDYFYRKRINKGRWTAWEKVPLEIQGNHLVVGIHNRRLHLLWPQFIEKADEPTSFSDAQPVKGPTKFWEIRLFWSELKKGKWSPKILSDTQIRIDQMEVGGNAPHRIALRTRLKPYIEARVFYHSKPGILAPIARSRFQKIGKQLLTESRTSVNWLSGDIGTEYLFAAPGCIYESGLFKHVYSSCIFYFSSAQLPIHHDLVGSTSLGYPLLVNIVPHRSFTVLDSKASEFINKGTFSYWDTNRTYLVDYDLSSSTYYYEGHQVTTVNNSFKFQIHYHPFVELFIKELNISGIKGLLNRKVQVEPETIPGSPPPFDFANYLPSVNVVKSYELPNKELTYPKEDVDFSYTGGYSSYNWELFFHSPFFIANKLAGNQKFEEALNWYHYIFDPTTTDRTVQDLGTPQQRYWITKPFYETTKADYYRQKIENLLLAITDGDDEVRSQVEEWRNNPFNPHLIARMRTVAYQKNVLIKYIQTLIAWGDQLYRRNTMESINEATQLYIVASEILGKRPTAVPKRIPNPVKTFYQLKGLEIDPFGNTLMEIENLIPNVSNTNIMGQVNPDLPRLDVLYFCIPNNDKFDAMWDTVEDRLFKIRHCMNIDGLEQQLPLFDPPIDPAMLVQATAGGIDLGSVLAYLNSSMPLYRFSFMLQRAMELCNQVKSLGGALLSACEKKDAEGFSTLRSAHELSMMDAVRNIKTRQIEEAVRTWEGMLESRKVIEERQAYYQKLTNDGLNGWETASLVMTGAAIISEIVATVLSAAAGGTSMIPDFQLGASGVCATPTVLAETGGGRVSAGLGHAANVVRSVANILQMGSGMTATVGGHKRRAEEWDFQRRIAEKELPQINKQIAAADLRRQITERELANHDWQKENLEKELEYMQSKFTNQELYTWMQQQISTVYFQCYQMAFDIAKRAEHCYRYELGLSSSNFIQFGYWDSLKKGLLAGERLELDLKRLEHAYYEQNRREYELTKHISMAQLDPGALVDLCTTGICTLDFPETIFDLDYPGHYFRRIKSISLSIPCIAGPYTTVACTLTLSRNSLRKVSTGSPYERNLTNEDPRFRDELCAVQSIATSSGQNDSGLFELNFRDERYLPFEGAGAISTWTLKLNHELPQFDLTTISDVIFHLKYTAREGGKVFADAATQSLKANMAAVDEPTNKRGLWKVFDIKQEFSNQWYQFLHPTNLAADQELVLDHLHDRLPYFTSGLSTKKVEQIEVIILSATGTQFTMKISPIVTGEISTAPPVTPGIHSLVSVAGGTTFTDIWVINIKEANAGDYKSLAPDKIAEIFVVVNYTAQ